MPRTSRLVLPALWALSLVAASQVGASAQRYWQVPDPVAAAGVEVRFVQTGTTSQGAPSGRLTALVSGHWVTINPEFQGGIVPLESRPR